MQEQLKDEIRVAKVIDLASQPNGRRKKALLRCSKCGSFEYTARVYN